MNILSDLVLHPAFAAEDVERERVILEEIKMDEDNPDYLVHEIHTGNFWKGDPLARPILGTAKSVSSFTEPAVRGFHRERFSARNMIFSAAGNLRHHEMIDLVNATSASRIWTAEPPITSRRPGSRRTLRSKTSVRSSRFSFAWAYPRRRWTLRTVMCCTCSTICWAAA